MSIEIDPDSPDEALPYVDVIVGGRPIRALLDTGSARTTVCPPAGCVIETRPAEGTGVFGGLAVNRRVWRTTVEFGGRPPCPIELDVRSATEGRDLLGQDVLSQFRCEYRFAESVLRLNGSVAQRPEHVFLDRGHHVYLAVEWDGATAEAVFDTGASLSVVDSSFIRSHPHLFAAQGQSEGTDASGRRWSRPWCRWPNHSFWDTVSQAPRLPSSISAK